MNDFFDSIYCINLKKRADRWKECLKTFETYGIEAKRFDAVSYYHEKYKDVVLGACGCWLSHYAILMDFIQSDKKTVFIFEDDFEIRFPKYVFNSYLKTCYSELPEDWDIFYLGVYFNKGYDFPAEEDYSTNLYKVNTGFCTHAMGYSRKGAEKLLSKMLIYDEESFHKLIDEYEAIDWFLVREFQLANKCYTPKNFTCGQRTGYSDIEKKQVAYGDFFIESYKKIRNIIEK